ncbi:hypothetical protein KUTeg_020367 [Tegillarca granosa]|uniref:B-block binding subunit of TFIIIC domain-containing protein n=1 Tax=Tegillarca granosa TaxID=220873 RepID=A0ABQ9ED41_TEGGR|nr:hypothetical protein KUTeg_020367 [Tegillarca granosa]
MEEGITLDTLWIRFKDRPQFSFKIDDQSKQFLWKCLEENKEEIYPIKVIDDKGIMGSCMTYETRKKITDDIRDDDGKAKCSFKEAFERWGNKLVIVASQRLRNEALFGAEYDPSVEWSPDVYCILERIGRSRYHGEVSRGYNSLGAFKLDPKTMFYRTILLVKAGIIKKQHIDEKSMKKLMKYKPALNCLKINVVPYRTLYPDATEKVYLTKSTQKEKLLRIVELLKMPSNEDFDDEPVTNLDEDEEVEAEENAEDSGVSYKMVYERPYVAKSFFKQSKYHKEYLEHEEKIKLLMDKGESKLEDKEGTWEKLYDNKNNDIKPSVSSEVDNKDEKIAPVVDDTVSFVMTYDAAQEADAKTDDKEEKGRKGRRKQKEKPGLTGRHLKRMHMILEAVRQNRLIDNTYCLVRLHFLCDRSVEPTDPVIKSTIEQIKMKLFTFSKDVMKSVKVEQEREEKQTPKVQRIPTNIPDSARESIKKLQEFKSLLKPKDMIYDAPVGDITSPLGTIKEPDVYKDVSSWIRYIPPLPQHKGFPKGWCLLSDILLYLPLRIFCSVIRITYQIEGLKDALKNPSLGLYPVCYLPFKLTQQLMFARKYIYSVAECCQRLCMMGLLSFGHQVIKEKDQVFVYLHKIGSLIDTRLSLPGYCKVTMPEGHEPEVITYKFDSQENVDKYWTDLHYFAFNSNIGHRNEHDDDIAQVCDIFLTLEDALSPKTIDTVIDDGMIPGDRRGAGGLDSSIREKCCTKKKGKDILDDIDRKASMRKISQRVQWSSIEDSILLTCKIAQLVMNKSARGLVVPWTVVRDVLYEHAPQESVDKTSHACQRRVSFSLKNSITRNNLSMFLSEVMQDQEIVKNFAGKKYLQSSPFTIDNFKKLVAILLKKFALSGSYVSLSDKSDEEGADDNNTSKGSSNSRGPPHTHIEHSYGQQSSNYWTEISSKRSKFEFELDRTAKNWKNVKSTYASRAMITMRRQQQENYSLKHYNVQDNFVINACCVKMALLDTGASADTEPSQQTAMETDVSTTSCQQSERKVAEDTNELMLSEETIKSVKQKIQRYLPFSVNMDEVWITFTDEDIEVAKMIYSFIDSYKEHGVTVFDLKKEFRRMEKFGSILKHLEDSDALGDIIAAREKIDPLFTIHMYFFMYVTLFFVFLFFCNNSTNNFNVFIENEICFRFPTSILKIFA